MTRRIGYVLLGFPLISETFVENEIDMLQEQGVDITVASIHRPLPDRVAATELAVDHLVYRPSFRERTAAFVRWTARRPLATVANVAIALRERSETMLRACADAGWMADVFSRAQVDQLHAHFGTEPAAAAMATARLLGVPFTFTIHALDLYVRTTGLCAKTTAAARVITVCQYNVAQLMHRCPGTTDERIALIYCGVDTREFRLRPQPPSGSTLRILSVGRLVPKKGFHDLLAALALVKERGIDVQLDIIGEGRERARLEALIDGLDLRREVHLLGQQPNARVREALIGSDLFVLACVIDRDADRDSMPVVIKEAMAVGVPVIATDEVGNPEMVDHRVGRLVPPGDPEALANGIIELAELSPEERRALGLAARSRAVERFDLRSETAKLRQVFDEVRAHHLGR